MDLKAPSSLWMFIRGAILAQGTFAQTDIRPALEFLDDVRMRFEVASDNEFVLALPPTPSAIALSNASSSLVSW